MQIGVPSRSSLPSYVDVVEAIDRKVADINARHGSGRAIRYRKSSFRIKRLVALYRLANFCIVSSLHDGMNLVAKEVVAAREDEDGVLVLSEMAGAAQQLHTTRCSSTPYDVEGFAAAIEQAIDMPLAERRRRMHAMRRIVAGRDIFGWASDILEGLEQLDPRALPPVPGKRAGERERLSISRVRIPPGAQPS